MDGQIMSDEELDLYADIKKDWIGLERKLRKLHDMQVDSGRGAAAGAVWELLGDTIATHGKATRFLYEHDPTHADDIQTRGPRR